MATNTNGLIYYKLDVDIHGYQGDITKNCGLRGEEIDGNFHFLRGEDIQSIEFDNDNTLFIKKLNGDVLKAVQTQKEYDFKYDKENNTFIILKPNGEELSFVIDGFKIEIPKVEYEIDICHNYTLNGDGKTDNPLHISSLAQTGRFKPAIKLIDTTLNESLPTDNVAKHDRYVTKENISKFGMLYPLFGVEKIANRLKEINSEWRIPSKEDWDNLLNTIDCENPNHNQSESNYDLGAVAGTLLKSTKYWEPFNGKILSEDAFGFSILPVGYCGNRGKKVYDGFGQTTAFWTFTSEDNYKDMFVKEFDYDKETVRQHTWGDDQYLSLRLVKDFNGHNYSDTEVINGISTNCIHIPGTNVIWTRENISFTGEEFDGFIPQIWNSKNINSAYEPRYFVNDWNGSSWDKYEIEEGEGIVLYEGDNGRMHEWLLVNGILIDSAVLLKTEFQKEIDNIYQKLGDEQQERIAADNAIEEKLYNVDIALRDKIQQETDERKKSNEELIDKLKNINDDLNQKIIQEAEDRLSSDEKIISEIELERSQRENSDTELKNSIDNLDKKIDDEIIIRQDSDISILETIESVEEKLQDEDKKLHERINNEIKERTDADTDLKNEITNVNDNLNQEINDRKLAIENEKNEREKSDTELKNVIVDNFNKLTKEDEDIKVKLNNEIEERAVKDDDLQKQITQNKVNSKYNTIIVSENIDGNGTDISVNIDKNSNIKIDENGCIYFDGNFGTF